MIHMTETKRVQISFSEKQMELIEEMKGELGNTNAEVIRNIVISWLAEKSFITRKIKNTKLQMVDEDE